MTDNFHSQFISSYHSNNEPAEVPDLYYRYKKEVVNIYSRKQNNNLISKVTTDDLCSIAQEQTLVIDHVLEATFRKKPILLIVTLTNTTNSIVGSLDAQNSIYVFWHNIVSQKTSMIYFDSPMVGGISTVALTSHPLTMVKNTTKEIEEEAHLRHLLVFGKPDQSVQVALIHNADDKSKRIRGQVTQTELPSKVSGNITAIHILTQDTHDPRLGFNDPRILVGTSTGYIQVFRFQAVFKRQNTKSGIHILSAQTLSEFAQYHQEPITYLTCERVGNRKIIATVGQQSKSSSNLLLQDDNNDDNEDHNMENNGNAHLHVIEWYGNNRRKIYERLMPSNLTSYTVLSARIIPTTTDFQIATIFQSTQEKNQFEVDVWSIKDKNVSLLLSDQVVESDRNNPIEDMWPTQEKSGYILLYPDNIIELHSTPIDEQLPTETQAEAQSPGTTTVTPPPALIDVELDHSSSTHIDMTLPSKNQSEDQNETVADTMTMSNNGSKEITNDETKISTLAETTSSNDTHSIQEDDVLEDEKVDTDQQSQSLYGTELELTNDFDNDIGHLEQDNDEQYIVNRADEQQQQQDINSDGSISNDNYPAETTGAIDDLEHVSPTTITHHTLEQVSETLIITQEKNTEMGHDDTRTLVNSGVENMEISTCTVAPDGLDNGVKVIAESQQSTTMAEYDEAATTSIDESGYDIKEVVESQHSTILMDYDEPVTAPSDRLMDYDEPVTAPSDRLEHDIEKVVESQQSTALANHDEAATAPIDESGHDIKEVVESQHNTTLMDYDEPVTAPSDGLMDYDEPITVPSDELEHGIEKVVESQQSTAMADYDEAVTTPSDGLEINNLDDDTKQVTESHQVVAVVHAGTSTPVSNGSLDNGIDTPTMALDHGSKNEIDIQEDQVTSIQQLVAFSDNEHEEGGDMTPVEQLDDQDQQSMPADDNQQEKTTELEPKNDQLLEDNISNRGSLPNESNIIKDIIFDEINSTSTKEGGADRDTNDYELVTFDGEITSDILTSDRQNNIIPATVATSCTAPSSPAPSSSTLIQEDTPTPKMIYKAEVQKMSTTSLSNGLEMVRNDQKTSLSQHDRLCVFFDIVFASSMTTNTTPTESSASLNVEKAVDTLKILSLDDMEEDWLMGYCYNNKEYPLLKLFIMRYNIVHKRYLLVMLQHQTMISEGNKEQHGLETVSNESTRTLINRVNRSCNNLAKLCQKMVPEIYQDLPLELYARPRGKAGNPFLNQEDSNLLKRKGLGYGAEMLMQVMDAKRRRRS
ncbi:hypothetical protein BC941DRAFT_502954 [Chlamydoabsidia padenii]|nr:hypothetical protein BC941DRAFT_502954 [Chlamydoabsidia padenii]